MIAVPRKNTKGRTRSTRKEIKIKPNRVMDLIDKVTYRHRDIYPGRIVVTADWRDAHDTSTTGN